MLWIHDITIAPVACSLRTLVRDTMSSTTHDIIQYAVPKASYTLLEFHEGLLSKYSMVWSLLHMGSTSIPIWPRTYSQPTKGRKQYTQQGSKQLHPRGLTVPLKYLHTLTSTTGATKACSTSCTARSRNLELICADVTEPLVCRFSASMDRLTEIHTRQYFDTQRDARPQFRRQLVFSG